MVSLERGVLDRAVHYFDLTVPSLIDPVVGVGNHDRGIISRTCE